MTFDATVTLGNVFTIGTLVVTLVVALIRDQVQKTRQEARIEALQVELNTKTGALDQGKVAVADCLRSHGDVVTTKFCQGQHDTLTKETREVAASLHTETLQVAKDVAEKFSEISEKVIEIATDQKWVKRSLKILHANTVSVANPHPKPLPPDPKYEED